MALGQSKTMGIKGLIEIKSGLEIKNFYSSPLLYLRFSVLLLFFFCTIFFTKTNVTYSLDKYEALLNSKKIAFTFDGFSNKSAPVYYKFGLTSRLNDVSIKIIGAGGKVISEGAEGTFTSSSYPVMVVMNQQSDPNWSARVILTKNIEGTGQMTGGIRGGGVGPATSGNDCCKNYDRILNNILNALAPLKPIQKALEGILLEVRDINHFLHDKEALNQGISAVQDSVKSLEEYDPTGGVKNKIKEVGNVGAGKLPHLDIKIFGTTFNLIDLTYFKGAIKNIRGLMSAIIWIELAMFFVRIFVPKLKV